MTTEIQPDLLALNHLFEKQLTTELTECPIHTLPKGTVLQTKTQQEPPQYFTVFHRISPYFTVFQLKLNKK